MTTDNNKSKPTKKLSRSYVNVRIGLGGAVFRIDKRDMPFVYRLLKNISMLRGNGN